VQDVPGAFNTHSAVRLGGIGAKVESLPGYSTAITLAFLQICGVEWVAMILEKNLDRQVRALRPGSSGIPRGHRRNLGLSLVSSSAEQLKSPLQ